MSTPRKFGSTPVNCTKATLPTQLREAALSPFIKPPRTTCKVQTELQDSSLFKKAATFIRASRTRRATSLRKESPASRAESERWKSARVTPRRPQPSSPFAKRATTSFLHPHFMAGRSRNSNTRFQNSASPSLSLTPATQKTSAALFSPTQKLFTAKPLATRLAISSPSTKSQRSRTNMASR